MKQENIQEFDITVSFNFNVNTTVEAETTEEAKKIAQKAFLKVVRDHLRDSNNINIKINNVHLITPEERTQLENDGVLKKRK